MENEEVICTEKPKKKINYLIVFAVFIICMSLISYIILSNTNESDSFERTETSSSNLLNLNSFSTIQDVQTNDKVWTITKYTGEEAKDYSIEITDSTKQKTTICMVKKPTSVSLSSGTYPIYDKEGKLISDLDKSQVKSRDAYCYLIDKEEYIKFGQDKIILEYQSINVVSYNSNWFDLNATLYIDLGNWNNTVNSIFVYDNPSKKFGANVSNYNTTQHFKYVIESTREIKKGKGFEYYISRRVPSMCGSFSCSQEETHSIDFADICTEEADCSFSDVTWVNNLSVLEIEFYAEYNETLGIISIDPQITITEISVAASFLNNITKRNNFTHLTVDITNEPYNELYMYFAVDTNTSTIIYDLSFNNWTGVPEGDPFITTDGLIGKAIDVDGVGDAYQIDSIEPQTSGTIMTWIKVNSFPSAGNTDSIMGSVDSFEMIINDSGFFGHKFRAASGDFIFSNVSISTGEWHHIAMAWNRTSTECWIYLDSVFTGFSSTACNDDPTSPDNFDIGGRDGQTNDIDAQIDEFMWFSTALNSSQISDIYNNDSSRFIPTGSEEFQVTRIMQTGNENRINVTISALDAIFFGSKFDVRGGAVTIENYSIASLPSPAPIFWWRFNNRSGSGESETFVRGFGTRGVNLSCATNCPQNVEEMGGGYFRNILVDSTDLDIDGPAENGLITDNMTIVIFMNVTSPSTSGNDNIISELSGATGVGEWELSYDDGAGSGELEFDCGGVVASSTLGSITENVWIAVAITVQDDTETGDEPIRFYIEGELDSEVLVDASCIFGGGGNRVVEIAENFVGNLDEMMIFERILNITEIRQIRIKNGFNYSYTPYQTISNSDNVKVFTIVNETNSLTEYFLTQVRFIPGPSSNNPFIPPNLEGNIILDTWGSGEEIIEDNEFPIFSNFWDNNASLIDSGIAYFNATITSTNGTAFVEIEGVNYTASNLTASEFNVSVSMSSAGIFPYYWGARGNGSNNNFNVSNIRFFAVNESADITAPNITIVFPENATNTSDINIDVNYTVSADAQACWWSNNSGSFNNTVTCGVNVTGETWDEGINVVTLYANDSAGNENLSSVQFTIDTVPPNISIIFPTNNTLTPDVNIDVNYTVSQDAQACWWTNSSGVTNNTVVCGVNVTGETWDEGDNIVIVYANDSVGNENSSSVQFEVDTINPNLNVVNPSNNSITSDVGVDVNYTVSDINLQACWWSNSSGVNNNTITCGVNITGAVWDEGDNIVTVYANDSVGNENSSSVQFEVDTINPNVEIVNPANDSVTTDTGVDVNYTVSDANLQACWWTNSSGVNNNTITCGVNITTSIWDEGVNVVIVYANDSSGNENSSSVQFTVDTVPPNISIVSPANGTSSEDQGLDVNYTVSIDAQACWWTNSSGEINTTVTCGVNVTSETWNLGTNVVIVYANDSVNNENSSSVQFSIVEETIPPNITIVFPTNNTLTPDVNINVNYTVSADAQACWWSNSSGAANNTITCGVNVTGETWDEGFNFVTVYANDSIGNENRSSVTFTVDTLAPDINISFPLNNTNTSDSGLDVLYTVSDTNLQACWYSNDTFAGNITLTCGVNITTVTWAEGQHNVSVFANDSVGNENSSTVTFTIDVTAPNVTAIFPDNNTITSNVSINFTANLTDNLGIANATLFIYNATGLFNSTFIDIIGSPLATTVGVVVTLVDGVYTWFWEVVDIVGNSRTSQEPETGPGGNFTLTIDTIPPNISIVNPGNNSVTVDTGVDVNYTVSIDAQACWWTNSSGVTNNTVTCGVNITTSIWDEGINVVTLYANDTVGNENSSSVQFTITLDNEFPQFSNFFDDNATLVDSGEAHFNVTITSTNGTAFVEINGVNHTASNSSASEFNVTINIASGGTFEYYWGARGSGSNNNFNVSNIRFYTVNTTGENIVIFNYTKVTTHANVDQFCITFNEKQFCLRNETIQFPTSASPPVVCSTEIEGRAYADSSVHISCYCNSTSWVQMDDYSTVCS